LQALESSTADIGLGSDAPDIVFRNAGQRNGAKYGHCFPRDNVSLMCESGVMK